MNKLNKENIKINHLILENDEKQLLSEAINLLKKASICAKNNDYNEMHNNLFEIGSLFYKLSQEREYSISVFIYEITKHERKDKKNKRYVVYETLPLYNYIMHYRLMIKAITELVTHFKKDLLGK